MAADSGHHTNVMDIPSYVRAKLLATAPHTASWPPISIRTSVMAIGRSTGGQSTSIDLWLEYEY